jgi:DNA mismatch repair protein MutS
MTAFLKQYREAKSKHPDMILLFRVGDFYELYGDDAEIVSKLLGLTLTTRNYGDEKAMMSGFPHHNLETYLHKLLREGHRVAVCDQVKV